MLRTVPDVVDAWRYVLKERSAAKKRNLTYWIMTGALNAGHVASLVNLTPLNGDRRATMINLTINGRKAQAKEGSTILEATRETGNDIPTLCHHEALNPYGACRVCLVEIFKEKKSNLVASCLYPVEEGLIVKTDSKNARKARKIAVELLLASAPKVEAIRNLAKKMEIENISPNSIRAILTPKYEKNSPFLINIEYKHIFNYLMFLRFILI